MFAAKLEMMEGGEMLENHEGKGRALQEVRKELEDAFLVMTHLETKRSNVIKLQAEAIEERRKRDKE